MDENKVEKILEMALLRWALDIREEIKNGKKVSAGKRDKITKLADLIRKFRQEDRFREILRGDSLGPIDHSKELYGDGGIKEDEVRRRLNELESEQIWGGFL